MQIKLEEWLDPTPINILESKKVPQHNIDYLNLMEWRDAVTEALRELEFLRESNQLHLDIPLVCEQVEETMQLLQIKMNLLYV